MIHGIATVRHKGNFRCDKYHFTKAGPYVSVGNESKLSQHVIFVLITSAQKPALNDHVEVSIGVFVNPLFVYASSEDSGEYVHLRRLT